MGKSVRSTILIISFINIDIVSGVTKFQCFEIILTTAKGARGKGTPKAVPPRPSFGRGKNVKQPQLSKRFWMETAHSSMCA